MLLVVLLLASCASRPQVAARGAISLEIDPDPIIAIQTGVDEWLFPFEVEIRETGGVDVTIDTVVIRVHLNSVRIYQETLRSDDLQRLGYPRHLAAGRLFRYQFDPSRTIPDPGLISRIEAELDVRGRDSGGRSVSASRSVSLSIDR